MKTYLWAQTTLFVICRLGPLTPRVSDVGAVDVMGGCRVRMEAALLIVGGCGNHFPKWYHLFFWLHT